MNTSPRSTDTLPDGQSNLSDWRGLGELIAITTDRLTTPVEGMHRAIADRWFGLAGTRAEPARRMYDRMAASTYKTIRMGGSALGASIGVGAEVASSRLRLRSLWNTPNGSYVQSIFNAVWGDKLEDVQSTFRIELGLRDADGAPVPPDAGSLARAFPDPKGRLVVLLHGLGHTEQIWLRKGNRSLAKLLEDDGFTVLLVRYNTGRPVTASGLDLADLLEEIRHTWPLPIEDLALVGHSMGGLVARSAVASAQAAGHEWVKLTHHLVAIGSPHLGTPIEKAVQLAREGLGLFRETHPLGSFVGERSAGIKDLRFGPISADDQTERIEQHFVAGSVTKEPGHPLAALVGDLVVRVSSATGRGRQRQVRAADVLVLGGRHHANLVHDVEVHSQIRKWLAAGQSRRDDGVEL